MEQRMGEAKGWAALALAGCLLVGQADAQVNAQWAAYAWDKAGGAWGLGWGQPDRNAAINQAMSNCGRPACELQAARMVKCIGVATSLTSKAVGFGSGTEVEAHNNALHFCSKSSGAVCTVQQVRCGR
jgi:hypothetical protein